MRYFSLFLIFLIYISHYFLASATNVDIISRKNWWADETLRYSDSPEWKNMYASYLQYVQSPKSQIQLDALKLQDARIEFLEKIFGPAWQITSIRYSENGHPLVAPIEKVKQISRIIIHHEGITLNTDETDEAIIRRIYKSHALSKQWWDIAYNYIIGQRGKIYEWRAGWDYVAGIHALYNNRGTVGVVILGDYSNNHLNKDQIAWLETLIPFLAQKYGITLAANVDGVECVNSVCDTLKKVTTKSLIGHRDVRATDCPWENVYPLIEKWITQLDRSYAPVYNPENMNIETIPTNRIMNLTLRIDPIPTPIVPGPTLPVMRPPILKVDIPKPIRYTGPKFRVKLSYPNSQSIVLATADGKIGKIMLDKKIIPIQVSQKLFISIDWSQKITLKVWETYYTWTELRISHTIVRIDSWDRVPDWDKSGKYNDNLFRDTIRVFNQKGKLMVINDLPVEWYLKWLGEVSNSDLTEKIKVIVVSARSYARYYMDIRNRKFATNLYDGSDNPDEFQKYLGYGYENRSPNVAKLVDATRNQVIVYSGAIIKAWYHSSSDGRTLSALEYCQKNGSSKCTDIPYLQSVADPWSVWNTRSGHGVGISWIGSTYWAKNGWDYKKIIQYYLKWVEIQKK
jgi:hypothetical protein